MEFYEKLLKLRKEKGISQEELGYKLNVTRQTVSKWELGMTTPEIDKLVELSKIFSISVDELLCKEENESKLDNKNGEKADYGDVNYNIENKKKEVSGIAITSLVLGILAIFLARFPIIGLILSIVAIIISIIANKKLKKENKSRTMVFIAIPMSAIALIIAILITILLMVGIKFMDNFKIPSIFMDIFNKTSDLSNNIQDQFNTTKQLIEEQYNSATNNIDKQYENQIDKSNFTKQYQDKANQMEGQYQDKANQMQSQYQNVVNQMEDQYQDKVNQMQDQYQSTLEQMQKITSVF